MFPSKKEEYCKKKKNLRSKGHFGLETNDDYYYYNTTNRVYKYVTVMRNPVDRYFSEFEHLHRSFGHGWDLSRSVDSCNDRFVRFFQCFQL